MQDKRVVINFRHLNVRIEYYLILEAHGMHIKECLWD